MNEQGSRNDTGERIARMTCPSCGTVMNPHAEKPVSPRSREEAAHAGEAPGEVIFEIHSCPRCGRVEERREFQN
jgi:ribosomal protein S27AE